MCQKLRGVFAMLQLPPYLFCELFQVDIDLLSARVRHMVTLQGSREVACCPLLIPLGNLLPTINESKTAMHVNSLLKSTQIPVRERNLRFEGIPGVMKEPSFSWRYIALVN
jgi:hypothetical protein